jgi:hypothetical protein
MFMSQHEILLDARSVHLSNIYEVKPRTKDINFLLRSRQILGYKMCDQHSDQWVSNDLPLNLTSESAKIYLV